MRRPRSRAAPIGGGCETKVASPRRQGGRRLPGARRGQHEQAVEWSLEVTQVKGPSAPAMARNSGVTRITVVAYPTRNNSTPPNSGSIEEIRGSIGILRGSQARAKWRLQRDGNACKHADAETSLPAGSRPRSGRSPPGCTERAAPGPGAPAGPGPRPASGNQCEAQQQQTVAAVPG